VRVVAGVLAVLVIVALVAVTAGVGIVAWTTSRAFAGTTGTLRLPGLSAPVTVTRDLEARPAGIAHVVG
jgi:penicillin G amidase